MPRHKGQLTRSANCVMHRKGGGGLYYALACSLGHCGVGVRLRYCRPKRAKCRAQVDLKFKLRVDRSPSDDVCAGCGEVQCSD